MKRSLATASCLQVDIGPQLHKGLDQGQILTVACTSNMQWSYTRPGVQLVVIPLTLVECNVFTKFAAQQEGNNIGGLVRVVTGYHYQRLHSQLQILGSLGIERRLRRWSVKAIRRKRVRSKYITIVTYEICEVGS
jgi:hypothetical protein